MMGSSIRLIMAVVGYILLVIRHRVFLLALPLIGIGIFAHWGGLRFTVYAVPIAAMSALYLVHEIIRKISGDRTIYLLGMTVATALLLYPNIAHIIGYKVPTVLNASEVADLDKLNKHSEGKDYTLAWWDYGYPIWYYADTSTLIDGGKHNNDNFIISKIMQTSSPRLAASLGHLAVETYAQGVDSVRHYRQQKDPGNIPEKFKMTNAKGEIYHAGGGAASDVIFRNGQKDQVDPDALLAQLEEDTIKLPPKTRDIYLYLPYRMLNIFPTVMQFGNLDLSTGQKERKIVFYPTQAVSSDKGVLTFANGIIFDATRGTLKIGDATKPVKYLVTTTNTKEGNITVAKQPYRAEGEYVVVYMKSYGQFVVMDEETFHSMYVQMFIMGRYDKSLFEPVVTSPYSRIYRLKI